MHYEIWWQHFQTTQGRRPGPRITVGEERRVSEKVFDQAKPQSDQPER